MSRKAKRVRFGTEAIDAALARQGITNRQAWEVFDAGESTWFRWKRRGVPYERLTDYVLFLDLDKPADLPADAPTFAWTLRSELHRQNEVIDRLTEEIDRLLRDA